MTLPADNKAQHGDRFRVLFEHSSDAHFIFDETGITDCNDATVQLLKAADKAHVLALHPAVLSPEFQPDGRRSPIETLPVAGEPYDPLVRGPQALKEWRSALQAE